MGQNTWLTSQLNYNLPRLRLCLVSEDAAFHPPSRSLRTPADAADFLTPLRYAAEEYFVSLHLNSKNEIIGLHEVSHGTLSLSLVHPREVFKAALLANSYAIIVCHNHPSGSTLSASPEDLKTTAQLLEAGEVLGVSVVDHLIVSPTQATYSLREHHPEMWKP
jgi:DNA repair protein RadC